MKKKEIISQMELVEIELWYMAEFDTTTTDNVFRIYKQLRRLRKHVNHKLKK